MEKTIDMIEYATRVCKGQVTNAEHQALRDITTPAIRENLNEACNRRAQLALATFEACLKSRLYAVEAEQKRMKDPFSPEYLLKSGRIAMLLDLLDDIIVTKRGFHP